ncbi:hypothetical protein F5Y15DRAFT_420676 [Xylariaceae sp. FL0016]|nr:hypothetical protein F5Y15DRAFT_420676 [Xylariaceae sp. FL0016]
MVYIFFSFHVLSHVQDIDLTIRFKNGTNTIFLFVDPNKPFSHIQNELLEVMKERFPKGLGPDQTADIPIDPSKIKFALPKSDTDPIEWKPLDVGEDDTPVGKGLKDNMMIAFAIASDESEGVSFEVIVPTYQDAYPEEEEEEEE